MLESSKNITQDDQKIIFLLFARGCQKRFVTRTKLPTPVACALPDDFCRRVTG